MAAVSLIASRYSRGRCTRCGSYELHRSRPRTPFERLLRSTTPFTPVRCPACGRREIRTQRQAEPRLVPSPDAPADPIARPASFPSPSRRKPPGRAKIRRQRAIIIGISVALMAAALGYLVGTH